MKLEKWFNSVANSSELTTKNNTITYARFGVYLNSQTFNLWLNGNESIFDKNNTLF